MSRKQKSSRSSPSKTPASSVKPSMDFGHAEDRTSAWLHGGHDAVTAAGQIIDFKTSTQRGDDMIDAMRAQADFYKCLQWPLPHARRRRGKSVTQAGMLWNDFQDANMHKLPAEEFRWARALREVMLVSSSYYIDATPEVKRERERVLEYLAQFDTHQGRRAAGVVARRVQFVLEGVEPRPQLDINRIRERGIQAQGKMLGDAIDRAIFDDLMFSASGARKKL